MNRLFTLMLLGTIAAFSAACAGGSNTNAPTAPTITANTNQPGNTASTQPANANTAHSTDGDIPAPVRAVLPDAQTFSKQHKDIPAGTVSEIEKATGMPVRDRDHHAYLAFSTSGGARRQVGAATVVNAGGQELVIVYDSRDGMPVIREVRGESLPGAFLDQFKGKDHDAAITFGNDIRAAGGVEEAAARQVTAAIKGDVLAMQALYGSAHTH
ncbi:MAG TPA: hypothetical protein VM943_05660 [Pyrinomonadaceae bacterium]|nr:hypothetical protein [Pyrinomonadaceae bacterium]